MKDVNNFQIEKVLVNFSLVLLIKALLLKKAYRTSLLRRLRLQQMNKIINLNQHKCQKRSFSKSSDSQLKLFFLKTNHQNILIPLQGIPFRQVYVLSHFGYDCSNADGIVLTPTFYL